MYVRVRPFDSRPTVPDSVNGFSLSKPAANEWCASAVPAMQSIATATKASTRMLIRPPRIGNRLRACPPIMVYFFFPSTSTT